MNKETPIFGQPIRGICSRVLSVRKHYATNENFGLPLAINGGVRLFRSERAYGVDSRGPLRGADTSGDRDNEQDEGNDRKGDGVPRVHSKQDNLKQARRRQSAGDADQDSRTRQLQARGND